MGSTRKHLLATDLSAGSDRALDRAVLMIRRSDSQLVVLHVLERSGGNDAGAGADVRIGEGEPAEVIASVAREEGCSSIVAGVARNETLGRFTLGATVEPAAAQVRPGGLPCGRTRGRGAVHRGRRLVGRGPRADRDRPDLRRAGRARLNRAP